VTAVYEIIKKASRFTDDPPEVIAYADTLSEAQALAHDYQVSLYGPSAYVTFRRAGDPTPAVPGSAFAIAYCEMAIEGFDGARFVVAKLRRVSSPPVPVGSVSDPRGSALGRLVDIIRLGQESRNYHDLRAIEWWLKEDFGVTADEEWAEYETVICGVLGVEGLEPLPPTKRPMPCARPSPSDVTFHEAEMNSLPYLVATVGTVFGPPAAELLTRPHERESALSRLVDVFRIGVQGQAFRDFLEAGRKQGKREAEIVEEWEACQRVALSAKLKPSGR
jgi:hypothetical protein